MTIPETRASLIMRLPDAGDVVAWDEFVAIYQPLVYRLALRKGLQPADAQEVVQEVMVAVSKAVTRFDPHSSEGRFRDWLFTIARNLMLNYLTRPKHRPWANGGSGMWDLLQQQPDPTGEVSGLFELEYRRELFRWAAEQIRSEVQSRTWDAFWKTSVEGHSVEDTAENLGMTVGNVYIARSRVMARLRDRVQKYQSLNEAVEQQSDPGGKK